LPAILPEPKRTNFLSVNSDNSRKFFLISATINPQYSIFAVLSVTV